MGYVRVSDPLPDELREAAKITGVQDIPGAWLKFCGHYADRSVHLQGAWQKWCVDEAKRERTEREKRPHQIQSSTSPENPYDGPRARQERAERNRRYDEAGRERSGPPEALFKILPGLMRSAPKTSKP